VDLAAFLPMSSNDNNDGAKIDNNLSVLDDVISANEKLSYQPSQ
jgi:hypothetical protein